MRFAILFSGCLGFVTTSLLNGAPFSETRDLPPLKLAAGDLDAILSKTHSFLNTANGPTGEGSIRESVKLGVRGYEIEIPHFSLASSVAFPNKVFGFGYSYHQSRKPISSMTIHLGDSLRRLSVSGESADKVDALSNLLENEFHRHSSRIGGTKFRRLAGACLSMLFLTSLMIGSAYYWKNRQSSALGIPICSTIGFLLVILVPWNRFLPGFVLYQRYSPFFLIRHASQIFVLALVAAIAGIPLSYFLARSRRKIQPAD
jgi:hypothetical protein